MPPRPESRLLVLACALLAISPAFALQSDRNQPLDIEANHQKSERSRSGKTGDPDVTRLDGNVVMTRGTMRASADHAVIYSNPAGVADAHGNEGGPIRAVLTGKPAQLRQVQDMDCRLVVADADTIDYDTVTGIALLTGDVHVVQQGKGDFRGERMRYDTNTGEMEGGGDSGTGRVHMTIQPKSTSAATTKSGDCAKAASTH
jgi:lipopolysaccharide export system protein LptA